MKNIIPFVGLLSWLAVGCSGDDSDGNTPQVPSALTVETLAASTSTQITFTSGGNVTSNGGSDITERGICWNMAGDPTIEADNKVALGIGLGNFNTTVSALTHDLNIYVKAYVITAVDTAYGEQIHLQTKPLSIPGNGVTDACGNHYNTVILADREWMAENLRAGCYQQDQSEIQHVTTQSEFDTYTSAGTGVWINYANNGTYDSTLGKLYNWYAITNTKKISPVGWSIPTDSDFETLKEYLGGWQVAGGPLKTTTQGFWTVNANGGATNTSGFSAVAGGNFDFYTNFTEGGDRGNYWTSADVGLFGRVYILYNNNTQFNSLTKGKDRYSASVRCIKNL